MTRLLIATCAALCIGCLVFAWSSMTNAARARDQAAMAEADARASEAEARLAANTSQPARLEQPVVELSPDRIALPREDGVAAQLERIAARLDGLEASVRQLQEQAKGKPPVDAFDTPKSIAQALRGLAGDQGERERRIALLERFLDLFPDDPKATEMLEALIAENLGSQPALGLASLERYGTRVVADPIKLDRIRANVLIQNRRFDEGRAAYERGLRTAPDAYAQADLSFWIAYSYLQEGRYDEAQARFESLIARYSDDSSAEMSSFVDGAKNQLELIAKYKSKK